MTAFDGGRRRAVSEQARAAYDESVANYRQTVLTAFQEVEDSLAVLRILNDEAQAQQAAVAAAEHSAPAFHQSLQGRRGQLSGSDHGAKHRPG